MYNSIDCQRISLFSAGLGVEDTQPSSTNVTPSSHSRLCQPTQALCSTPHSQTPCRVIIAGALSFVGSRLAAHLTANGLTVYGFASTSDTRIGTQTITMHGSDANIRLD